MIGVRETLEMLGTPRETLRVLLYIVDHPHSPPLSSVRNLGVSLRTWYGAIGRLEDLGLLQVERRPGGKKIRRMSASPEGRAVLRLLGGLPTFVANSKATLEWELQNRPPPRSSERMGELYCRLAEALERRGDLEGLDRLVSKAVVAGRPGEAELARGVAQYLRGMSQEALGSLQSAHEMLAPAEASRSFRRTLFFQGSALAEIGEAHEAYRIYSRLRRLAIDAGDLVAEADARLGIGIQKALLDQQTDAEKQLVAALRCARLSGSKSKEAKVLTSLSFVEFFSDAAAGIGRSEEALQAAEACAATVLQVHIHANRALMMAVEGEKARALAELGAARKLAQVAGHERGRATIDAWAALVRRILRHRRTEDPSYWKDQVLSLLRRPKKP